ncbi:MAG: oxygenase MpaB family protein [Allosphingosinicella sp.]|uniref:oxygenase MpaB family protein n=1 Tax=Allosphingosinicella sp. TaxID=2823234 RepID=UPI0039436C73
MGKPLTLPGLVRSPIEAMARDLLRAEDFGVDFAAPAGAPALVPADGISWRVFRNPVTLFIGGVAAVLLELAEPRVRHGVWDHSGFRADPLARLRRTGLAAMVTVYGPEEAARAMIAGVNRLHARVSGLTAAGVAYRADDPELLDWVQATAAWGFLEAFCAYAGPLPAAARDLYYAEGAPVAALYGATGAPASQDALRALFARMGPKLEPSATLHEFLAIMRRVEALPGAARPAQALLVRAAVDLLPGSLADRLGLGGDRLAGWQKPLVRALAAAADRLLLPSSPPVQASRRLGLPDDWPWR